MDPIVQHVQENLAMYAVIGVVLLPVAYVFRKQVVPFLYHTAEFLVYCALTHALLGGFTRAASWFREQTTFQNAIEAKRGPTNWTTPLNFDLWQKELYNPQWLFYVEIALALGLLYVVVAIRPIRHKRNVNKLAKNKTPARKNNNTNNDFGETTHENRTSNARARQERLRGAR